MTTFAKIISILYSLPELFRRFDAFLQEREAARRVEAVKKAEAKRRDEKDQRDLESILRNPK